MKFTLSWLKDHLETDVPVAEVAAAMTMAGLEVEHVTDPTAAMAPFTVARIVEAVPHPNADRLRVCQVETVDGKKDVEIEPGTQPSEVIVLRGAGIPVLGGRGRGDHHVHVEVVVPDKLSADEEEALRQIATERGEQVAEAKTGFLSGLRRRRRKRG